MSVWFTSDLHFGHRRVADLRGFGDDTEAHDAHLMKEWAKRVHPDNIVWVLGDLTVSKPAYALGLIADLPGRKHFISGNHDDCHPMHRDFHKKIGAYNEVFESVSPFARQRWNGVNFLMSHFPYEKDRHDARYMQYRLRDEGEWLLHGHTHGPERREGREIHVGLDAWDYAPVSLQEILKLTQESES